MDENSPTMQRIFHHIGDQISIVNDLASYEMERQRFESGKARSLINIVSVIMKLERVDVAVAKTMAYTWQLCMENEILNDLEVLKKEREKKQRDGLSVEEEDEDWRFIHAWLMVASGNLFASIVMSRYGGEGARLT